MKWTEMKWKKRNEIEDREGRITWVSRNSWVSMSWLWVLQKVSQVKVPSSDLKPLPIFIGFPLCLHAWHVPWAVICFVIVNSFCITALLTIFSSYGSCSMNHIWISNIYSQPLDSYESTVSYRPCFELRRYFPLKLYYSFSTSEFRSFLHPLTLIHFLQYLRVCLVCRIRYDRIR